jgi:hypothetical protein
MILGFSNLIKLALVGVGVVVCANFIFLNVSAQKKRSRAEFSHNEKTHKQSCGSCHKLPSRNWRAAGNYPNLTDYPNHESCVGCHRQDFFAGNRPAICTICHVEAAPRGKARLRFPVRGRSQEFTLNFPHSVHQDVIALNRERESFQTAHFVSARFEVSDEKKPQFNSCAICHQTASNLPGFTARKPLRTESLLEPTGETFTAQAAFFKNSPENHASCFSCHYQGQKPFATDCASCHTLTSPYFDSNIISRYSLKFDHEHKDHSNKDCVTCHIRITQNSDLRLMVDADVPLLTCSSSSCHGNDLKAEIAKRTESLAAKQNIFQCNYCHTSAIGSYKIPITHQSIK